MYKIGIECESIEDQGWGIGRIITKLLQEIDRRPELKKEFRFFLYFKSKIPDYAYLANDIFIKRIIKPSFAPVSFSLYYYLWLPIKLWFEGLDIMYFPNYMLPIIFHGKSMVTLTEDAYYEYKQGSLPLRYRLAYSIFCTWAARHATKIISVSEASKHEVARLFKIDLQKIAPIPNGVEINTESMNSNLSNHPELEEEFIFYLGQAFPRRRLKESILAFEKIKKEFPRLKFMVIGRDKYNPPIIQDLIVEVNRRLGEDAIFYKEYAEQEEMEILFSRARATVYVSSKEAFGLPPLESLGYGSVPVVADMPATREIFGESAFFVKNPDSVDEIADAIKDALINQTKRSEIKQSAPEILERYTWQKHADRFLEVVRDICKINY